MILIFAVSIYSWECLAQLLSVSFADPLLGMMQFMGAWFSAFLYGGFLIAGKDMVWPLKVFFYITPLKYTVRSMVYTEFVDSKYDSCDNYGGNDICYGEKGKDVLDNMNLVFRLFSDNNTLDVDIGCLILIALVCKLGYIIQLVMLSKKASTIV